MFLPVFLCLLRLFDIKYPVCFYPRLLVPGSPCSTVTGRFNPNRIRRHYIFKDINLKEMKEMRLNYLTLPSLPKVKEFHFKIMNDIYPSKEFLKSKFDIGENSCQFCEIDIETTKHIVFDCNHSKRFWTQVYSKMSCIITCANPLEYKQIKLGVLKRLFTTLFDQ